METVYIISEYHRNREEPDEVYIVRASLNRQTIKDEFCQRFILYAMTWHKVYDESVDEALETGSAHFMLEPYESPNGRENYLILTLSEVPLT